MNYFWKDQRTGSTVFIEDDILYKGYTLDGNIPRIELPDSKFSYTESLPLEQVEEVILCEHDETLLLRYGIEAVFDFELYEPEDRAKAFEDLKMVFPDFKEHIVTPSLWYRIKYRVYLMILIALVFITAYFIDPNDIFSFSHTDRYKGLEYLIVVLGGVFGWSFFSCIRRWRNPYSEKHLWKD